MSMTQDSIVALLGAMTLLALIPSPSVGAVIARAIASGFMQGMYMVAGILMGDFIFIVFAIYGLSTVAEQIDAVFLLLKYLANRARLLLKSAKAKKTINLMAASVTIGTGIY